MSIHEKGTIDSIISYQNVGAGNAFQVVANLSPYAHEKTMLLDKALSLIPGALALSINDMVEKASLLAQWYSQQGIKVKDPVALYMDEGLSYMLHFIALSQLGAIPVFINGGLDKRICALFVERVGSKFMMTDANNIEGILAAVRDQSIELAIFQQENIALPESSSVVAYQHVDNDPVLLAHTSGTTGIPKAVRFNHLGFFYGVGKQVHKMVGTRIMTALPHSHASALSIMMSGLIRGATIKIQTRKEPLQIVEDIENFKPDFFLSFPKIYTDLCQDVNLDDFDLSSISYWLSTGDVNHERHVRQLMQYGSHVQGGERKKGSLFIDNLGSSEFGFAAFRNIHKPGDNNFNRCIGKPFDWVDAAIVGEDGGVLGPNEVGYLGVASPSVTDGYWNNSLLTEKNRKGKYWLTGDWAYRDAEGNYFHVDRITDCIPTPAGTVYSAQTEELLMSHFEEIYDCSVVGVTNEKGETWPSVIVELAGQEQPSDLLERVNELVQNMGLPPFQSLQFSLKNHHFGVTGKVLKRVLRDELLEQSA